jgi:hypothetical protein
MTQSRPLRKGVWNNIRLALCRLLCDETPPPPPRGNPKLASFVPGQVMIVAQFPTKLDLNKQTIADRVRRRYETLDLKTKLRVDLAANRVAIVRGPELTLAAVLGDVPEGRRSPRLLLEFIRELHQAIELPPLPPRPRDQNPDQGKPSDGPNQTGGAAQQPGTAGPQPSTGGPGGAVATSAARAAARKTEADDDGFDLRAASPNWFSSGAPYITGGGPGAAPVAISQATANNMAAQPWLFEALPAGLEPGGPTQVEVAILDTLPSPGLLLNAYDSWVGNEVPPSTQPPLAQKNPLLTSLLSGSDGAYNVIDVSAMPDVLGGPESIDVVYDTTITPSVLGRHQYSMTSHGLFVAGIIRSMAPQAKLRLIEILNNAASGTMESLANGLSIAIQPDRTGTPLVINCSFTFAIPRPGDPPPDDLEGVPPEELPALTAGLQSLFAVANQWSHVVIVAAAGNTNGELFGTPPAPPATRPMARYPAAFQDVAGVAALDQDDNNVATPPSFASYSNLGDDQSNEQIAAFGGEIVAGSNPPVSSDVNGMLGVFVEPQPVFNPATELYDPVNNPDGWVRWAGTSFATPIITAAIANLLANNLASATTAIGELQNHSQNTTTIGALIEVRQGP